MIKIDDTYSARGDFSAIEGPLTFRKYNVLPLLPNMLQFPAGTTIRNNAGALVMVSDDGASWDGVGGGGGSVFATGVAPLTLNGTSGVSTNLSGATIGIDPATGTIGGGSGSGFLNWQSNLAALVAPNFTTFVAVTNSQIGWQVSDGFSLTSVIATLNSLAFHSGGPITFNNKQVVFDSGPGIGDVLRYDGTKWDKGSVTAPTSLLVTLANGGTFLLGRTNNNDFFDFNPNDGLGVEWRQGVSFNPNRLGARSDNVMSFGWNVSNTGIIDPTKGHLSINFEDYWVNEFDDPQSEWYITAGPPTGVGPGYRPIAINTSHTNPLLTKIMVYAHDIQLGAGAGPSGGQTQIALTDGALNLYSPDTIKSMLMSNDAWTLRGHNVAGSSVTISLFDANDPVTQPDVVMRVEGTIVPNGNNHSLGLYGDGISRRMLWENVAAHYGQFITAALGPADYDHVGQLTLLYPSTEDTYGNLYVQAADSTGTPRWERVVTDLSGLNFVGTEGTLKMGAQLQGASADVNEYLLYTPAEVGAAKWSQSIYQAANGGSARKNQVHAIGWNIGPSGGPLVAGEASLGFSLESFYQPAGTAVSEFHIIKHRNDGTLYRPFSMEFNRSTGVDTLALSSDRIYVQSPGQASTWWMFNTADAGELFCYTAGTAIYWDTNNQTFLQQRNANNNGYIPVIGTNSSDQVVLGSVSYDALVPGKLRANTIDSASGDLTIAGTTARQGTIGKASGAHFGIFAWSDLDALNSYGAMTSPDGNQSIIVEDNTSGGNVLVFSTNGTQFYGGLQIQTGNLIASKIGPSSAQQHTVPAVASDTIALLGATQELTAKTLTAPVMKNGLTASGSSPYDFSGSTGTWKPPTGGLHASLALADDGSLNIGDSTHRIATLFANALSSSNDVTLQSTALGAGGILFQAAVSGGALLTNGVARHYWTSAALYPASDLGATSGRSNNRWSDVYSIAIDAGASTFTATTAVAAGSAGFIFNYTNAGNTDDIARYQAGGVDQVLIGKYGTYGRIQAGSTKSALMLADASGNEQIIIAPGSLQIIQGGTSIEVATTVLRSNGGTAAGLGDATHYWTGAFVNWNSTKLGAQLTAAATITPTVGAHHVTGGTTIDTIAVTNVPTSGTVELILMADGGDITISAAGNVKKACTISQDTHRKFFWDGSKWYPHS